MQLIIRDLIYRSPLKYDKFECGVCGEQLKSGHSNYFGPTKAALSFLYVF